MEDVQKLQYVIHLGANNLHAPYVLGGVKGNLSGGFGPPNQHQPVNGTRITRMVAQLRKKTLNTACYKRSNLKGSSGHCCYSGESGPLGPKQIPRSLIDVSEAALHHSITARPMKSRLDTGIRISCICACAEFFQCRRRRGHSWGGGHEGKSHGRHHL